MENGVSCHSCDDAINLEIGCSRKKRELFDFCLF